MYPCYFYVVELFQILQIHIKSATSHHSKLKEFLALLYFFEFIENVVGELNTFFIH